MGGAGSADAAAVASMAAAEAPIATAVASMAAAAAPIATAVASMAAASLAAAAVATVCVGHVATGLEDGRAVAGVRRPVRLEQVPLLGGGLDEGLEGGGEVGGHPGHVGPQGAVAAACRGGRAPRP